MNLFGNIGKSSNTKEKEKYSSTKFITGIRCYSALAVFLIHCGGGGFRGVGSFCNKIVDFGKYGVVSFFVISAFTICMSVDKTSSFNFFSYMSKRFYRVLPLYYLVIVVCYMFTNGVEYYNQLYNINNSLYSLFLHITLLNIFDVRYMTNVIGVEWSIPIEFIYYLFIPFIFFFSKKNIYTSIIALLVSFIITTTSYTLLNPFYLEGHEAISHHFSLEKYAFCFVVGIILYVYWDKIKLNFLSDLILVVHIIILFVFIYIDLAHQEIYFALWIALLVNILNSKSYLSILLFENFIVQFLGKISYSFYLLHFIVILYLPKFEIEYLNFIVPLLLTIILSSITYKLIEEPFIKFSKKNE